MPGPTAHAGRRAPVRRSAGGGGRAAEIVARRSERRAVLVAGAVRTLLLDGPASHEAVAERTGLPLGQLRRLHPTSEDLLTVLAPETHQAPETLPNPTTPTHREARP